MAITKIAGELLESNLIRSTDLAFNSNLLYVDVANGRIGIKTDSPGNFALDVAGNTRITGNQTITGDLIVQGTTTSIDSQNLVVEDNILTINENASADTDSGIMINRGSSQNPAVIFWDETDDVFKVATTTSDGSTRTDLTSVSLANLRVATTPSNANDAASKAYVDSNTSGLEGGDLTLGLPTDSSFGDGSYTLNNAGSVTDAIDDLNEVTENIRADNYVKSVTFTSNITAAGSGTTVTLSAASTSGGSTTVNAYRTHLKRVSAGASTSLQVLTTNAQTISGAKTHTGTVTLNDSVKLKLVTSCDLEIYHKGNNSYIDDAGTGTIFYRSGTQTFQNAAGSKTMAVFNAANSVDLNYNNSTKFQTSNTGVALTGVMAMAVESGDPSGVANNAHIYAKDDSASAEVYVRDEAGNVTKLSPHNKQGEWEYFSRNTKTGKTVRVNMEEMIKDIEKLTGKKYIKEE